MTTSLPRAIADIDIPDTALVRATTEFIRDAEDDLLFDHSRRVYLFGALQGRRRGLDPDLELLYVGAMFHDLGLTEPYRTTSTLRFEVDGANAAHNFLLDHGVTAADARKVWLGIALHTTPGVPEFLDPETALVTAGVETDVLGIGRDDLSSRGTRRGHRGPSTSRLQAAHPQCLQRRRQAASRHRIRHRQRRRAGSLRRHLHPRRFRERDSDQHLARIAVHYEGDPRRDGDGRGLIAP